MKYIVLITVIAIVLLQLSGSIPLSSVGGPMTIALVFFVGALAVAIHEAWTNKRGVLGWIVNIVVAFVGAFFAASIGGPIVSILLSLIFDIRGSLMSTGGPVVAFALAGMAIVTLLGSWAALQLVNRMRDKPASGARAAD